MRPDLCLKVEVIPGSSIKHCVEQARRLAGHLGIVVEFDFNGVIMIVHQDSDVDDQVAYYHQQLGKKT